MSKADPDPARKEKEKEKAAKNGNRAQIRWALTIFLTTIVISGLISFTANTVMARSGMAIAFVILLLIILVGILFDMVGVAVASAEERPFHSMAARKVPGAAEAIKLLRNANRVSSICNDVIGDICGVVSGAASAAIAVQIVAKVGLSNESLASLFMSALVAGLTVGGKAVCKSFAMNSSTKIVFATARVICWFRGLPGSLRPKKKTPKQ